MSDTGFHINKLAVLGVGLIGGSLARALQRERVCGQIVGYGRNEANLVRARELGVINDYSMQVTEVVKDADMILLSTPLSANADLLHQIRHVIHDDATITDAGSVKGSVVAIARETLEPGQFSRFVPGHPIAGTEQSGVEASFDTLYENRLVILTPGSDVEVLHINRVVKMWEGVGAEVVTMDTSHHDRILAATSHLPHLLAYALVDCLAGMRDSGEIFKYAAGGFTDFTRIASSSPRMWADICAANRDEVLQTLDHFDKYLLDIRKAIESGDSDLLLEIFDRARTARDSYLAGKSEK